ncbi:MAG TPA: hypothetical protein VFS37_02750 [Conexibacter sp.]|nr:hypothetical protein [Conexibacter sp.]
MAGAPSTHALTAGESAWLATLSCALLLLAAVVALGPALGRALPGAASQTDIWEIYIRQGLVHPEPTEHARYLISLAGPLLASGGVLALRGQRVRAPRAAGIAAPAGEALLVAFLLGCLVYQHVHVDEGEKAVYFTYATLAVALALAAAGALALRTPRVAGRLADLLRETTAKRVAAIAVASAFTVAWLLSAFNTDATIGYANREVRLNVPWWIDESAAILGGHAPLVDFHAQYGHLWAYIGAAGMALLGSSLAAYSGIMLAGTAAALAAVYAVFRRLAASSLAALALFAPFVATSFFVETGPLANRYGPANLFSLFPIRYGGPFVLLWLVVRRVGRGDPGPPIALFALAGLVVVNNPEFGLPAAAATFAGLLWTLPERNRAALVRLTAGAAAGLAVAVAAVCLLTLAVGGSLPRFGMLSTFPRIYGTEGLNMLPMPVLGLHLAIYVTLAGALVLATVRTLADDSDRDPALTAALAWAGVFGLGAGVYYVGRSYSDVLIDLFSAWALALALLLVAVVRATARAPSRRPRAVELLVLAGFGLTVCSLAQTPTPWSQVERLQRTTPSQTVARDRQLVARFTEPGEPVALLIEQGHRIAAELGVDDVTPYAFIDSMMTRRQWDDMLAAFHAAQARRLIVPRRSVFQEEIDWLQQAGFQVAWQNRRLLVLEQSGY